MNISPAPTATPQLASAWYGGDMTSTSLMEATSFATPVLERFFIRTVREALPLCREAALDAAVRAFLKEESAHARAHQLFNACLEAHLGVTPPAARWLERTLGWAEQRLPLRQRVLLAATLEHFAAVLSGLYLAREPQCLIHDASARALFRQHAEEELAHRAVVFDLWLAAGGKSRLSRWVCLLGLLVCVAAYSSMAGLWILYRKLDRQPGPVLAALAGFMLNKRSRPTLHPLRALFTFTRSDFHPDSLTELVPAHEGPGE